MKQLKDLEKFYQLIIIDGNNVIYKYKINPFETFKTSKGKRTGIIYGMLAKFLPFVYRQYAGKRTQMIFCWDGHGENLRKSVSGDYKSNRDHSKEEHLFEQMEDLKECIPCYGYQCITSPSSFEADDVGYSVMLEAMKHNPNMRVLLISEDKDWLQMVRPGVHLYKPRTKQLVTEPLDFSFEVYHCFAGDAADVIKPVTGFSKAEVMGLAMTYKTMSDVMKEAKEHPGKIDVNIDLLLLNEEKLMENSRMLKLYHIEDLDIKFNREEPEYAKLFALLESYEFKKLEGYILK